MYICIYGSELIIFKVLLCFLKSGGFLSTLSGYKSFQVPQDHFEIAINLDRYTESFSPDYLT